MNISSFRRQGGTREDIKIIRQVMHACFVF